MKRSLVLFVVAALGLSACSSDGTGSVVVRISGEGPAKSGYPFDDGGDVIEFADGWSLTFSRVLVSIASFELQASDGSRAAAATDGIVADLHLSDPVAFELDGIGARRWDRVSFDVVPPEPTARLLEGVTEDDVARMRAGGFAVLVEGTATEGDDTIPFSFGIVDRVHAYDCHSGDDGTAGLVVPVNGIEEAEITIHLDHFFLDSIAAEEPSMRFEHLASLAGADNLLTLDDLAHTPVTDVRDRNGDYILVDGRVLVLDPGPFTLDAERSIASYVRANAITLAHFEGEGHCSYLEMDAP